MFSVMSMSAWFNMLLPSHRSLFVTTPKLIRLSLGHKYCCLVSCPPFIIIRISLLDSQLQKIKEELVWYYEIRVDMHVFDFSDDYDKITSTLVSLDIDHRKWSWLILSARNRFCNTFPQSAFEGKTRWRDDNKIIICSFVFLTWNQYDIFSLDFSNVVQKSMVKALAEADDQEVVKELQVCHLIFFFCNIRFC